MRRSEQRESTRSERIIHSNDANYRPRASSHVPRSRAKIRELDVSGGAADLLAFEAAVRHHIAADSFGAFGADVSDAARALSAGRETPKTDASPLAVGAAAVATFPRRLPRLRLDARALPKPVRHLLAGAFSGGACARARHIRKHICGAARTPKCSRLRGVQACPRRQPRRWRLCA